MRSIIIMLGLLVANGCATVQPLDYSALSDEALMSYYYQTSSLLNDLEKQQRSVASPNIVVSQSGEVVVHAQPLSDSTRQFNQQRLQHLRKNMMSILQEIEERGIELTILQRNVQ